jgi:hypothetical protein
VPRLLSAAPLLGDGNTDGFAISDVLPPTEGCLPSTHEHLPGRQSVRCSWVPYAWTLLLGLMAGNRLREPVLLDQGLVPTLSTGVVVGARKPRADV